MTIKELITETDNFEIVNESDFSREIKSIYCCDLLSIVMGRAPADSVWVTVMGNINGVAVAVLADISVMIAAEGINLDDPALLKAKLQGVNVLKTKLPIFEAVMLINEKLQKNV